ncbi:MAG: hypothetical protein IT431_16260 [Phycisphaerales bacterium]|nr:hypothetical protein [Phycisphaerales bacterium]
MTKRDAIIVGGAVVAVGFGGLMLYRAMFAGRVSDGQMRSIFDEMPTEELIHRRITLATLLAETPPTNPKTEFRLKNEEGLAALDALLKSRGVDPEKVTAAAVPPQGDR